MVNALCTELELRRDYTAGEVIETIYLGGGTPSLLLPAELNKLFATINNTYEVHADPEITLEANPDDLTPQRFSDFRSAGVNRLSIGIQSFDDDVLRSLNRSHDSITARTSLRDALAHGFNNISIDLIYSIPGQDEDRWRKNIEEALQYHPSHISAYSLTIEERTVFGNWASHGKFKVLDDDAAANQFEMLMDILEGNAYEQYEISNFSMPGFISKHNSHYWKDKKFLGIGPSAHSYNGVSRQHNVANNYAYIESIELKRIPEKIEILSKEDKVNEYLLTTLRTKWGTDLTKLKQDFGIDLLMSKATYLEELQLHQLAVLEQNVLMLTRKGKLLADKIASDLFVFLSQPTA